MASTVGKMKELKVIHKYLESMPDGVCPVLANKTKTQEKRICFVFREKNNSIK